MIRMSEHLLRGKMTVVKEKVPLSSDNILSSVRINVKTNQYVAHIIPWIILFSSRRV